MKSMFGESTLSYINQPRENKKSNWKIGLVLGVVALALLIIGMSAFSKIPSSTSPTSSSLALQRRAYPGLGINLPAKRVLVASGHTDPTSDSEMSEIIDLTTRGNMKCDQFYDLLAVRWGSVGGYISNFPVLCGGQDEYGPWADCEVVGNQNKHIMMSERRASASGVVLNETTLWIVGGNNGEHSLRSSDFVTLDGRMEGPKLPNKLHGHCMLTHHNGSIFIIGGTVDDQISNQVLLVDPFNEFYIQKGLSLNERRTKFSCGKMESGGSIYLVVAGGEESVVGHRTLDSVEILDLNSPEEGWKTGPKLPHKLSGSSMITSPDDKGVVIVGGWEADTQKSSGDLFELRDISQQQWQKLNQTLKKKRTYPVAIPIPEEITNCRT